MKGLEKAFSSLRRSGDTKKSLPLLAFKVAQESECLQHLIRTDEKLAGRSFKELLVEDERPRFADFIASSTRAFRMPEGEPTPPCCLRMSFGSGASATASGGVAGVAADIYHVPVPGLFGAQEPYHLIAFKEVPWMKLPVGKKLWGIYRYHQLALANLQLRFPFVFTFVFVNGALWGDGGLDRP